jgi:arylsulfatase A-like enzyme
MIDDASTLQTEYVVVLIIDGPRFSETFGDSTAQYIPYLGKELIHEGTLFKNFRNNGPTYTNAGHTAITTGVYQSISNGGKELPKNPSMFQYYLKEKKADKSDAYIVASKGKLEILGNTKNKKWWNTYLPSTYCGPFGNSSEYANDLSTVTKVESLIGTHPPKLMLINLLAADTYGHSNEWEKYLGAIQQCDSYVRQIWSTIQSNTSMRNKTALFITNDHGRHLTGHKNGFVNHGDRCEGCRHIALLAVGPDFKKDTIIANGGEQIDISKTIAYLLGFQMPTSRGRLLTEMFN